MDSDFPASDDFPSSNYMWNLVISGILTHIMLLLLFQILLQIIALKGKFSSLSMSSPFGDTLHNSRFKFYIPFLRLWSNANAISHFLRALIFLRGGR